MRYPSKSVEKLFVGMWMLVTSHRIEWHQASALSMEPPRRQPHHSPYDGFSSCVNEISIWTHSEVACWRVNACDKPLHWLASWPVKSAPSTAPLTVSSEKLFLVNQMLLKSIKSLFTMSSNSWLIENNSPNNRNLKLFQFVEHNFIWHIQLQSSSHSWWYTIDPPQWEVLIPQNDECLWVFTRWWEFRFCPTRRISAVAEGMACFRYNRVRYSSCFEWSISPNQRWLWQSIHAQCIKNNLYECNTHQRVERSQLQLCESL